MDYRLIEIKKYSQSISKNREIIREFNIPEEKIKGILDDLEKLSESLKNYGNSIKYPLIINGEEKYFTIEAYAKELYKKYYISDKYSHTNRFGEKVMICYSFNIALTFNDANKLMEQRDAAKKANKYYSEEIFLPMSTSDELFLIYSWEEIYNDLLEFTLRKLKKEADRQEIKIKQFNEIND